MITMWVISCHCIAQVPAAIVREKCVGGSDFDELLRMIEIMPGVWTSIGSSASSDGQVPGNNGMRDGFSYTWDEQLNDLFTNGWGGPVDEKGRDIVADAANNVVVLMNTQGTEFGCAMGANISLLKMSETGTMTHFTCQSGSGFDEGVKVMIDPATQAIYHLANIRSSDGFYSGYTQHGNTDIGIFKYDQNLNFMNGILIGSSGFDLIKDAWIDGNTLWLFGETNGADGDMAGTTAYGSDDLIAFKFSLDTWSITQKLRYGGSNTEHIERATPRPGGGFALFGNTWSTTFFNCSDPTSNAFRMGVAANGTVDWTGCLQGSGTESISSAVYSPSHNVHFVGGHSSSTNGDFVGGDPSWDAFVAAVNDGDGEVIWQFLFGGSGSEYNKDLLELASGNLLALNSTSSNDGDVQSTNHGDEDAWLVEFSHTTSIAERTHVLASLQVSPVPTTDLITVQLPAGTQLIELYDVHGRRVSMETLGINSPAYVIDLSGQPAGIYTIRTSATAPNGMGRCVKM